jgi:PKD repeat protein
MKFSVQVGIGALAVLLITLLSGCANQPPAVKILEPNEGEKIPSQTVRFQGEWSDPDGTVEKVEWSFGDGSTSTEGAPEHTYQTGGRYVVGLTVTDNRGATSKARVTIQVNQAPHAEAIARAASIPEGLPLKFITGDVPLTVELDGTNSKDPDGKITSYHWDLGDGRTSTQPQLSLTYQSHGEYEVTLIVTDDQGLSAQDTVAITVIEAVKSKFTAAGITYALDSRHELDSVQDRRSFLYRYVIDPGSAGERLTQEQVQAVLLDAVRRAAGTPRVGKLIIWLFREVKSGFMSASDFDHYLGAADWEAPGDPAVAMILFNEKYFNGTAPAVYGYHLIERGLRADDPTCPACAHYRIQQAEIFLESERLCRKTAQETLLQTLRAIAPADGYLVDVYGRDLSKPLGLMIAVRAMPLADLPLAKLKIQSAAPGEIETIFHTLTVRMHLPEIPNC